MVSSDFQRETNSQNENLKIDHSEYIETALESYDIEASTDTATEVELEMAETIYDMRREFKRQNKRLRKFYSSKEPRNDKPEKAVHIHHFSKRRALA